MALTAPTASPPRPWLWAGLFIVAMGAVAAARILDLIEPPASTILAFVPLVLIVPMARAARRKAEVRGIMSPALAVYNRRMLGAGAVYMLAMILAGSVYREIEPGSAAMWLTALAPILPILGMIWAMWRYLAEETDEYLRYRAVKAALFGLGAVLVLGSVWGFLETFGLVPHVWSWWVFPVWAIGLGASQCWMTVRGA